MLSMESPTGRTKQAESCCRSPHGQDETGGELLQIPAGVHKCRRVGHKGEGSHEVEIELGCLLDLLGVRAELFLSLGDIIGYPAEKVLGPLKGFPFGVPFKVSFDQDNTGVFRKLRRCQCGTEIEGFLLFIGLAVGTPRLADGHAILRKLVVLKRKKKG
jgi:hypothetical protein